jgi:hypothetical protein
MSAMDSSNELLSIRPALSKEQQFTIKLLEKISNRKMALQIERNRENKEQLISFVFGFNLPVTIIDILHYNKWFKTNCKL